MRFFNTAGPIKTDIHYHVPLLSRLDVEDLLLLIRQWKYFVLHAPRQTGKTSALFALRDQLNASGEFRCVYVNVEVGQSAREDVAAAMRAILGQLASEAEYALRRLDAREDKSRAPSRLRSQPRSSRDVGPLGRVGRQAAGAHDRRD